MTTKFQLRSVGIALTKIGSRWQSDFLIPWRPDSLILWQSIFQFYDDQFSSRCRTLLPN